MGESILLLEMTFLLQYQRHDNQEHIDNVAEVHNYVHQYVESLLSCITDYTHGPAMQAQVAS